MSTHDTQGRPWAKLSELKAGDKVQVDGDFTCIPKGSIRTVEEARTGLWIGCDEGQHYLGSHLNDFGSYVGVYKL